MTKGMGRERKLLSVARSCRLWLRKRQLVLIAIGTYTDQQMTECGRLTQVLSRERQLAGIEDIEALVSVGAHDNRSARWVQLLARRHPTHAVINYDNKSELRRSLQCLRLQEHAFA